MVLFEGGDRGYSGNEMRHFAGLAVTALALLLVGCGGSGGETAATAERTTAETQTGEAGAETTSETTPLEQDRAYMVAFDFCANAPLGSISLIRGGSPEELARDFADQIRPQVREAALQGCLAALQQRD